MAILSSPFDLPAGRLLAFDLGQARTGAAVCDVEGILATPLAVLRRHATRAEDYAGIAALIAREKVVGVVVGLPLASQGEEARRRAGSGVTRDAWRAPFPSRSRFGTRAIRQPMPTG